MNFTPQYPSLNMVLNEADKNAMRLKRSLDKQKSKSTFDLKASRRRGSSSKMHISSPLPPPYQEDAFGYQPLQSLSPTHKNMEWDETNFFNDEQSCPSYYSRSFELDAENLGIAPPSLTHSASTAHLDAKAPAIMLELVVGHKLATKLQQKRIAKRQARLQDAHDAWERLGLDTRKIAAQGGQLPPHFWSPPQYGAEEMNRRLGKLCL